jgi:ABC-type phosphate transport system auxiliary subunit
VVENHFKTMILNEDSPLPGVEAREYDSLTDNHGSLYGEEARTSVSGRSVSYLDISTSYNDTSLLSDTSLQRMRCLSQSINDLKILREKQQERKHEMRDLLDDDFLQDHAKKLEDVRRKIKELEAKYQSPQRKFDASSLDRKKKHPGLKETNESSVVTGEISWLEK